MEEEEEDDVRPGISHNWIVNINLELEDPDQSVRHKNWPAHTQFYGLPWIPAV